MLTPTSYVRLTSALFAMMILAMWSSPVRGALFSPNDLGEQIWLDWWAEDLPDGAVSSWTSRYGNVNASQGNTSKQPVKQNGEVYFAQNGQDQLVFPQQGRAHHAHRGIMILFRIDLSGSGDGVIFAVNGYSGGWERQPAITYNRNTNKVGVGWKTPTASNGISFDVPVDGNQWHCLVSRRVGKYHYASLDGYDKDGIPGETMIELADWAVPQTNISVNSYIGDFRPSSVGHAIDTVMIFQGEMDQETAEKLMGWGMWRRNAEGQLPTSHPYRNSAPQSSHPKYEFSESSSSEWSTLAAWWDNLSSMRAYSQTPVDLTGWVLDFEDEFDTHSVTHDVKGKGTWFAPTHPAATGSATSVYPTYNSSTPDIGGTGSPATYIQSGSTMTIRMQNSSGWKSGAFCTVNSNGYGRTWKYPYVEARMKIGASTTGNKKGAWPALWLKSINYFSMLTESNLEYDIYEGYGSDPKGYHHSIHNWPAVRNVSGRITSHRYKSHYYGLTASKWPSDVDLFDGQYHTYATMVTPDWVYTYFDGLEVGRFPTPVEMKQPLWVLLDLAMHSSEVSQASGIYDLVIDYVKVYQNPAYLGANLIDFMQYDVLSYAGSQDVTGGVTATDNGASAHITGNAWKRISLPYTITPYTILEFDVNGPDVGEALGIGFDNDNTYGNQTVFQIGGTEDAVQMEKSGISQYVSGSGTAQYSIDVGSYYTGAMTHLIMVLDDDANASGDITFTNVRVFEGEGPLLEVGKVDWVQDSGWKTVNLTSSFINPVVVMSPVSDEGGDPCHARVRNVTSTSFEFTVEEWAYLDGSHSANEELYYLVMDEGSYTIGGLNFEAGTASVNDNWKTVNLDTTFNGDHAYLPQVVTVNGSSPVNVRIQNTSSTSFQMMVDEEEAEDGSHSDETVHYIVIDGGSGSADGIGFAAGKTADAYDHSTQAISYGGTYVNPAFFAQIRTNDGGDTCGLRIASKSTTSASVFIEEEESSDSEIEHTYERIGWFVIEMP